MSNPKMCPLMAAAILIGADGRSREKYEAGWDYCSGAKCAWWDEARGKCAVVPNGLSSALISAVALKPLDDALAALEVEATDETR